MRLLILCILMLTTTPLLAAQRIAVISTQNALLQSKFAQEKFATLRALDINKRFESIQADLQAQVKQLEKNKNRWDVSKVEQVTKDIEYKKADLQLLQNKLKNETAQIARIIDREMGPKLVKAVEKIVADQKIDILLDKKAVVKVNPSWDITNEVLKMLNK